MLGGGIYSPVQQVFGHSKRGASAWWQRRAPHQFPHRRDRTSQHSSSIKSINNAPKMIRIGDPESPRHALSNNGIALIRKASFELIYKRFMDIDKFEQKKQRKMSRSDSLDSSNSDSSSESDSETDSAPKKKKKVPVTAHVVMPSCSVEPSAPCCNS